MKKVVIGLVILGVIGFVGWKAWERYQAKQQAGNGRRRGGGAVAVELAPLDRRTLVDARVFTGSLEARSRFLVAPKIPGRLARLAVDLGDTVKAGDVIAELDGDEYEQDLKQAQAELAVARANAEEVRLQAGLDHDTWQQQAAQAEADLAMAQASVEDSKSSLEAAQREYDRVKALREKQIAAESELDSAHDKFLAEQAQLKVQAADLSRKQAALKAAQVRLSPAQDQAQKSRIAYAEALVAQKEAAVKAAEIQLAYTRIRADWSASDGTRVIGSRLVDVGAQLKANDPIVSVLDISQLTAAFFVTEGDYPKVKVGLATTLTTDAWPGRTFSGKISRVAPELETSSRQARVEVAVDNADGALKPGMFVRLRVEFGTHENATSVPLTALVRRNEQQGVFTVPAGEKEARFVPVTIGLTDQGRVEITADPMPANVVVLGQHLLTDGTAVVQPGDKPAGAGKPAENGKNAPTPGKAGKVTP